MAESPPTPIIQPNLPFSVWNREQIYNPADPSPTAVYVPNVNDMVVDWDQGLFRVIQVDYTTGESTLSVWTLPLSPDNGNDDDVLLGAGPGTIADSYRCFVDRSVKPSILALDKRLHVYGTTTTSIKIFKGTDISDDGEVISQFYDTSWNLLGENIPLEVVATTVLNNNAIKAPKVGYTTAVLEDGELLTVVTYDDVGGVVSTAKVLVQNSSFIRPADAALKYITSISLDAGPFKNPSNPTDIQFPINMPVQNLNMYGVVTYSDGSTSRLPVDGTKFQLFGLDNYIATQQGQTIPLALVYNLSEDEYNYIGAPSASKTITAEYSATTMPTDGAYSVKLYVYPEWDGGTYRLRFYLYNLDREDVYDVTPLVQAGGTGLPFDPTLYGTMQHLSFAVQMDQVDAQFAPWRFVQTIGISLLQDGDSTYNNNWTVTFVPGQDPPYGGGVQALCTFIDATNTHVDLTCQETDYSKWLDRLYYNIKPLYDTRSESKPPEPNIMAVYVNGTRYEFPTTKWNTIFSIGQQIDDGQNLYVEWISRDGQNDRQLGVSAFPVRFTQGQA